MNTADKAITLVANSLRIAIEDEFSYLRKSNDPELRNIYNQFVETESYIHSNNPEAYAKTLIRDKGLGTATNIMRILISSAPTVYGDELTVGRFKKLIGNSYPGLIDALFQNIYLFTPLLEYLKANSKNSEIIKQCIKINTTDLDPDKHFLYFDVESIKLLVENTHHGKKIQAQGTTLTCPGSMATGIFEGLNVTHTGATFAQVDQQYHSAVHGYLKTIVDTIEYLTTPKQPQRRHSLRRLFI